MSLRKCYIKVIQDNVEDNGTKFTVYYGFRQEVNKNDGSLTDVITPSIDKDGKPVMKARSFKIKFTELFKNTYKDFFNGSFPRILLIDLDKVIGKDASGDIKEAFFTKDKMKVDGKRRVRKDKYGNEHLLLVINSFSEEKVVERTDYSFDDIDNIG